MQEQVETKQPQYYVDFDVTGNIVGFYVDEIHGDTIPETAVPITVEQWQTYVAAAHRYKRDGDVIREKTQAELDAESPRPDPKDTKLVELDAACNATILAGFESSALGEPNVYDFDYEAQINLAGMLQAITASMVTEPIIWKASGAPKPHTFDQFKQVFSDGLTFKNSQIQRYWELKAQLLAAETPEEIASIVW